MSNPDPVLEGARAAADAGELDAALAAYSRVLDSRPHDAEALLGRARAYEEIGDWGKALADLDTLLQAQPNHREGRAARAQLRALHVSVDKALADLEHLLRLAPEDPELLVARGRLCVEAERYEQALSDFTRALSERPERAEWYAERAEVYRAMGFENPCGASGLPPLGFAVHPLGFAYHAEYMRKAADDYAAAFEREPDIAYLLQRAAVCQTGEMWERARETYERVAALARAGRAGETAEENERIREQAEKGIARSDRQGQGMVEELHSTMRAVADGLDAAGGKEAKRLRAAFDAYGKTLEELTQPADEDEAAQWRAAAVEVVDNLWHAIREPDHEYATAELRDYRHLDRRFYERSRTALEKLGFRWVADREPLHNTRITGTRVLMRFMLSDDRRTGAAIYQVQAKRPVWYQYLLLRLLRHWVPDQRVIEMETEFADGCFCVTNNLGGGHGFLSPPEIDMEQLGRNASAEQLLECHATRVRSYKAQHGPMTEVAFRGLDDVLASQARQLELKRRFRRSIGGVTDAELRSLTGAFYAKIAPFVREELARRLADEENSIRATRVAGSSCS
ncbi:MAG TPA: tetratricopeptide repeat protein [Burkholderiales bacterium]|nr:tetratricopeptide repeat protein [Burkholderiales bacterium]